MYKDQKTPVLQVVLFLFIISLILYFYMLFSCSIVVPFEWGIFMCSKTIEPEVGQLYSVNTQGGPGLQRTVPVPKIASGQLGTSHQVPQVNTGRILIMRGGKGYQHGSKALRVLYLAGPAKYLL